MDRTDTYDAADSEGWELVGFALSSRYRYLTLESLAERPAIPSFIANRTGLQIPHVSRALQELKERALVRLLVPEDRSKGRVYGVSIEGRRVVDTILANGLAKIESR